MFSGVPSEFRTNSPLPAYCTTSYTNFVVLIFRYHISLKVKADIALPGGTPPQSYGTSLAVWDHTVLPATRHK